MPMLDREANAYRFTDGEKESIRRMLERGARADVIGIDQFKGCRFNANLPTEVELDLFIEFCSVHRMNPLTNDICFHKRHGTTFYVTSIDRLRSIAEETGCYAPGRSPLFYNENGELQPGGVPHHVECFVKKQTADGTWHEISDYAYLEEYAQPTWSGQLDRMWATWVRMPHSQLAKCGDARVLRRAFPQQLAGLCIFEEMMQAEAELEPQRQAQNVRPASNGEAMKGFIAEITRDDKVVLCKLNDRSLVRLLTDGWH